MGTKKGKKFSAASAAVSVAWHFLNYKSNKKGDTNSHMETSANQKPARAIEKKDTFDSYSTPKFFWLLTSD